MYEELVSFVKEFGHARVPHKKQTLRRWVDTQRKNYNQLQHGGSSSILLDNQIVLLNKIGFEWKEKSTYIPNQLNQRWSQRYEELVSYVETFGHAQIPVKFSENLSLGKWVSKQRSDYKKFYKGESCSITDNQIQLLNKVGFEWKTKSAEI